MTEAARPQHAPLSQWAVQDDCLMAGGLTLGRLAQRAGRTPFYAYDRHLLSKRVAHLRAHMPQSVQLHYAMKANPMPALVCHMAPMVDGIDVASGGELKVALDAGMNPQDISFAGPGKSEHELAQAIGAGILINIESPREASLLAHLSKALALPARVAVRVNPDYELKSSGMKMAGGPKQFGVDAEHVPDLLREIEKLKLSFEGFHIFAGSQNLKPESICEAQIKTLELATKLASAAPSPVKVLNMGGGFGIPYFPGEQPLDIAPIGENLGSLGVGHRAWQVFSGRSRDLRVPRDRPQSLTRPGIPGDGRRTTSPPRC
jgi:diaminopimelate decarboxylase